MHDWVNIKDKSTAWHLDRWLTCPHVCVFFLPIIPSTFQYGCVFPIPIPTIFGHKKASGNTKSK